VSDARYHQLLGRLLDGELTSPEMEELARLVEERPDLQKDLRQHLELWEHCSQKYAPERSPEAFCAAWHTRLRAESPDDLFSQSMGERLADAQNQAASKPWIPFWRPWLRPAPLRLAACLALLSVVVILAAAIANRLHRPSTIPPAAAKTNAVVALAGESVCSSCVLHEDHQHLPAIRLTQDGVTRVVYVELCPLAKRFQSRFCGGPKPIWATGVLRTNWNRVVLEVRTLAAKE
jgi:anti-sigma factor RsiW